MHLRGISPETERLAKVEAARRGISLSEFVSEAIVGASRGSQHDAQRRLAPLAGEREWYEQHKDTLARKHRGKIIAIVSGKVIVVGDTLLEVANEVRSKVGDRPVYVVNLASDPKRRLGPSPARVAG